MRAREQSSRIGLEVKRARVNLGITRQQAADHAGVSWSTELRVELGDPGLRVDTMCAVAEAVGLDVVLRAHPGRTPTLRDTGQLEHAEMLAAQAHPSWQPRLELIVGKHGEAIDLGFFGPAEILGCEIERMASDFQDQYRRADSKRHALASRHQRPVHLVLVVEDTPHNRAAIKPHLALIRIALPAGSREILGSLRSGRPLGRDGLLWLRRRRKGNGLEGSRPVRQSPEPGPIAAVE